MKGVLRSIIALQVAVFALWGRSLLSAYDPAIHGHDSIATLWLATEPVDPRDLLAGNYVALRYPMRNAEKAGCPKPLQRDTVYIALAPSGKRVLTSEGEVELSDAVECRIEAPRRNDGRTWIVGRRDTAFGGERLLYGIERMYVSESSPLRKASSGDVVAKVVVNDSFAPRIVGLVTIDKNGTTPH